MDINRLVARLFGKITLRRENPKIFSSFAETGRYLRYTGKLRITSQRIRLIFMYHIFSIQSPDNTSPALERFHQWLESQGHKLTCRKAGIFDENDALATTLAGTLNDELFEEISSNKPDIVLLDPELPGQYGYRLCRGLKNSMETNLIPVIFASAKEFPNGIVAKSLDCGANDFISLYAPENEIAARLKGVMRNIQALNVAYQLNGQLQTMNTELYERNLQVEKELYVTRQLQQSLLPPVLSEENNSEAFSKHHFHNERLRISGVYIPCDALGGDIYDVIKFPDSTVGVAIADVSGHGVPAGFVTAIFKSSFYRITHNHNLPGDILFHLNNELADIVKTGEYVTTFYCRIRPEPDNGSRMVLDYSGAGHPYPLYYKASENKVHRLNENGTPLVWVKNMEYPMGSIHLEPGDQILLFTDGLSEMRNTRGDLYGEEALEECFLRLVQKKPERLLDELIQVLSDFTEGHPLEDDLSMVLIEAK